MVLVTDSGLSALRDLVAPPVKPFLGGRTWEWLYGELGTRLPADYVALMETYGGGAWSGWLRLWAPLDPDEFGLAERSALVLDSERAAKERFPEYHPLPLWPEPGGYLPFGDSIDGDGIGWLTVGSPDEWPLILTPRNHEQGPPLSGSLAETVLEWLSGRLRVKGLYKFDKDELAEAATFWPAD
ncbi:SMI1/KNR4 family protein [Lentzea sp. NPDC006480]|uniref:SMI1/KNR4 family protein n=1 Tax=Lentzea sp. NPDC006480 TaxID=3157176 RepID=UPI0033BB77F4